MSGHLRSRAKRAARSYKRRDPGERTLGSMPWKVSAAFGPLEQILTTLETTGEIEHDSQGAIYRAPSSNDWNDMAAAIEGFAQAYDIHASISGREMPTASLHQLANRFKYGMFIFRADVDAVRRDLAILKAETLPMTENYTTALIQTVQEAA
jgi:hypothetical protein